jgi:hypothetical protein
VTLAAMQPYFFPYLGYFGLIKHSDRFIVCDMVQFMRHGWIARNRILKHHEGWQYMVIPLAKHSHKAAIKDVTICVTEPWQDRIFKQLVTYKKIAPYYEQVIDFLQHAFCYKTDSLSDLNTHLLSETCRYIGISFKREVFSEMDIAIEEVNAPDEWAIGICRGLAADTYVNPPGGMDLYDRSKYIRAGLSLQFLNINLRPYDQKRRKYEGGLSIIDVMMFNTPQEIQGMLDDYELLQ